LLNVIRQNSSSLQTVLKPCSKQALLLPSGTSTAAAALCPHLHPQHTFWFGLNLIHSTLSTVHKQNTATLKHYIGLIQQNFIETSHSTICFFHEHTHQWKM